MQRTVQFLSSRKGLTFLAVFAALSLGLVLGPIVSEQVWSHQDVQQVALLKVAESSGTTAAPDAAELSKGFRAVARQFEPYVVNIRSRTLPQERARSSDRDDPEVPDLLERFFRGMPSQPQEQRSLGSGTIVDSKGFIITNTHVVTGMTRRGERRPADRIEVMLSNGKIYRAEVVGFDEIVDIAVLKINADETLPAATIGDTDKVQIGDWVLAMGSPFGLEQTVTAGIISAKGRPGDRFGSVANLFGDYIQTDAAINPGNSGGPLVDMNGRLIGINTFISTRSGGSQGIGFAIPSHVFVNAYNQLVREGRIERGFIGISMNTTAMTPEMADYFGVNGDDPEGIKDGDGVIVTDLIDETGDPGSTQGPAAQAGLEVEDVVVKIGDREIETPFDLRSAVASTPPGEKLRVTVVRRGEVRTFDVELARRQLEDQEQREGRSFSFEEEPEPQQQPKEIGLYFEDLNPDDARRIELPEKEGRVLIEEVVPGSLADEAGLQAGLIISQVNGERMDSADEFYNTISNLKSGQSVVLRVVQPNPQGGLNSVAYTSFKKP
ncbi:MAG TPA: trypsin-like peptidase domain-containing protein [Acidobacteriota bacterium]|nr:trypsin-like peptidase domain-containing protein [Acidobacteriota bacterium]